MVSRPGSITQDDREQTDERQETGNVNATPDRPHAATNQTMAKGWACPVCLVPRCRSFLGVCPTLGWVCENLGLGGLPGGVGHCGGFWVGAWIRRSDKYKWGKQCDISLNLNLSAVVCE